MKNVLLSFVFLLFTALSWGQTEQTPARELTDKLTEKYNLTSDQSMEMLTIQERKFRNLAEIADLKKSNPSLHIQKIRALKTGIDASIERMLSEDQRTVFLEEKAGFRKQKSIVYTELKSKGASQIQIDYKISELEEAAMLGKELQ